MPLLEAIFEGALRLRQDEQIYLWSKAPHERLLLDRVGDVEGYAQKDPARDLYFGVAPRVRGHLDTVSRVTALWADLDFKDYGGKQEKASEALVSFPVEPSFVIHSGHGYHAYWLLDAPTTGPVAQEAMRAIAHAIGSDPAVSDPTRVLRVPGTKNCKDPAYIVDVSAMVEHDGLRYSVADLARFAEVNEAVRITMATGSTKGYRSRSERDWAILRELTVLDISEDGILASVQQKAWGDRYQEKPRLLQYDIEKARGSLSTATDFFLEMDDAWYCPTSHGRHQVSTFVIVPKRLLEDKDGMGEDALVGDVRANGEVWADVVFPRSAFTSQTALHRSLPSAWWQWLGTDQEARQLLVFLMSKLVQGGARASTAVSCVGRHGDCWVTKAGALDASRAYSAEDAPYTYMTKSARRREGALDTTPALTYTFPDDNEYRWLVHNVSILLPQVNKAGAVAMILGWFMAAPLKPVLNMSGIRFPHLNVFGTMGSGKTTSLTEVFMPLLGVEAPRTWTTNTTPFVLRMLLSSSNAIPVIFGEFRVSTVFLARNDLLQVLRQTYDVGMDARGRADQTTEIYPLLAPIVVDGEDPVADGATRERCIIVNLHPEDIASGSPPYQAFQELQQFPLSDFAGRYIQRTLREGTDAVLRRWQSAHARLTTSFSAFLPNRVRRNLAVVILGLELYNEHVAAWGGTAIEYDVGELATGADRSRMQLSSGATRAVVDDFVEDVIGAVANEHLIHVPFIYYYSIAQNILWVHFQTAVRWWEQNLRSRGKSGLEPLSLRAQLAERCAEGEYAIREQDIVAPNGTHINCFGVDVAAAQVAGLDVPDKLNAKALVIRGGGILK